MAGGGVDQAVAAIGKDCRGERLAGGIGKGRVGTEIGSCGFAAHVVEAAGEAGDQLAIGADILKDAGIGQRRVR